MDFKKRILKIIDVPVGRIAFRKDKWGTLATVYFNGISTPVSIGDDFDDIDCFLHSVKNGSEQMIKEAEKCYGKNWRKYIKVRG